MFSAVVARTAATSLELIFGSLAVGWVSGYVWRLWRGRSQGLFFTLAAVAIPPAIAGALDARLLLIGLWDALFAGAIASAGLLLALHRSLGDRNGILLMLFSCFTGLAAAELATEVLLPAAPAFPSSQGPSLLLSDALRVARTTGFAPTQAGSAVCYAIYGGEEVRSTSPPTAFPATWQPRAEARERILHLGDSMVWGSNADGRFTDDLDRLEPDVEHVNAAIAGTAPDVYLALMRRFIAKHEFSAVVMHLTPNDYGGVDDAQYPCSNWSSLLVYEPSGTRLRYATAYLGDRERSPLRWLVQNSPPPYVVRACVRVSAFAANLAAAFVEWDRRLGGTAVEMPDELREAHVTAILSDARDESRARHVPLVVDSFRDRREVESGQRTENATDDKMQRIAEGLGIVTLDTWEPLRAAVVSGVPVFTNAGGPADSHFSAQGHALIAQWLHDELPGAIDRARAAMEAPSR